MLRLVHEALLRSTMNSLILATAKLVTGRLGVGLAGIGLCATGDLVGATGDAFFGFVECGFGGVGSLEVGLVCGLNEKRGKGMYHLLAGLGVEVFAECVGHVDGYGLVLFGGIVLSV